MGDSTLDDLHDKLITVRWDDDEGRVVYDLGDIDQFSAIGILTQVVRDIQSRLPDPREISDPMDADE